MQQQENVENSQLQSLDRGRLREEEEEEFRNAQDAEVRLEQQGVLDEIDLLEDQNLLAD